MSAHRPALDRVPCTSTTGMSPGRKGSANVRLVGSSWRSRSPTKNPWRSQRHFWDWLSVHASAALGSTSSRTSRPSISTVRRSDAVDLERAVDHRLRELAARVGDAQQRRHRRPGVRTEEVLPLDVRMAGDRPGGQGRTDPRTPVSRPEAPHPELGDRHELDQLAVRPPQRVRRQVDRDLLAEGERVEAGAQVDHRAVRGRERPRQPPVVEVGRDAQPGIELVRSLAIAAGKQERPRADRRLQVVLPLSRRLRVRERQLREREQRGVATAPLDDELVQLRQGRLRVPAEALAQVPAVQDVLAELARRGRVQGAARQVARDLARRHPADAHRRAAGHQQERGARGENAAQRVADGTRDRDRRRRRAAGSARARRAELDRRHHQVRALRRLARDLPRLAKVSWLSVSLRCNPLDDNSRPINERGSLVGEAGGGLNTARCAELGPGT